MWENDASLYVPAGEIGRALEPTAPGTPQERAANLTKLLEQVPARIEQARKNLLKPPRSYTESAIFKTEGTTQADACWRAGTGEGGGRARQGFDRCIGHCTAGAGGLSQVSA